MSECILYDGPLKDGYARVRIDGRNVRLHRHVYAECFGTIPEGAVIHHTCGVKHCLNPEHLEAITQTEHMQRHDVLGSAAKREATHCKRGHPRTPENIYVERTGWWRCRICKMELQRERRAACR